MLPAYLPSMGWAIHGLFLSAAGLPVIRFGSFSNGFKTGTSDLDVVFVGSVEESAITILQTPDSRDWEAALPLMFTLM